MISLEDIRALDCYLDPIEKRERNALIKHAVHLGTESVVECGKKAQKLRGCITGHAWTKREMKFIEKHIDLKQNKLAALFYKTFGNTRTKQAIRMRKSKLVASLIHNLVTTERA